MSNEILSQDQIEEMLRGAGQINEEPEAADTEAEAAAPSSSRNVGDYFTKDDQDILGEMGNICMGTSATTMFTLLSKSVDITTPRLEILTIEELSKQFPTPLVVVEVTYTKGVDGNNLLILKREDVALITDLLLGGDGKIDPDTIVMDELHLSAIQEVMNQMVGSSATSLSELINKTVDISTPQAKELTIGDEPISEMFADMSQIILKISFKMEIEDLLVSEIMQILPIPFAKDLAKTILQTLTGGTEPLEPIEDKKPPEAPVAAASAPSAPPQYAPPQYAVPQAEPQYAPPQYAPPQAEPQYAPPQYAAPQPGPQYAPPQYPPQYAPPLQYGQVPYGYREEPVHSNNIIRQQQAVDVREAKFPSFEDMGRDSSVVPENIGMILDVPMQVTVELGKIKKQIKDVLSYNTGSVIVLDKIAGEAVDILVNGKLIGRGEVVVIEDNYGVRITEINIPSAESLL